MNFSTEKTKEFKEIMAAIASITEEVTFVANSEGIKFQGMDPSHVCMMNVDMEAGAFDSYECTEDIQFGIRFEEFGEMMKRVKKEPLHFDIEKQKLTTKIGRTSFKIRLTNGDTPSPIPKLDLDVKFQTYPDAFLKAIGDVKVMSNYFNIKVKDGMIHLRGKGDGGEANIAFNGKGVEGESGTTDYPIEYTEPIIRAMKNREYIAGEFTQAKPLRLMLDTGIGGMDFFVAPRIPQ